MGHRHRDDPADLPGCGDRDGPGDQPAPAVPDDDRVAGAKRPDDAGDVGGQGARVVAARRLVAGAVAAQVHGGGPVAGRRDGGQLVAPGPPELREAVQEEHQRSVADHRHVEAGTVGGDHAVLPRAGDPGDGGVRSWSGSRHSPTAGCLRNAAVSLLVRIVRSGGPTLPNGFLADQGEEHGDHQVDDRHDQERPAGVQAEGHQAVGRGDREQDDRQDGDEGGGTEHGPAECAVLDVAADLGLRQLDLVVHQLGQVRLASANSAPRLCSGCCWDMRPPWSARPRRSWSAVSLPRSSRVRTRSVPMRRGSR